MLIDLDEKPLSGVYCIHLALLAVAALDDTRVQELHLTVVFQRNKLPQSTFIHRKHVTDGSCDLLANSHSSRSQFIYFNLPAVQLAHHFLISHCASFTSKYFHSNLLGAKSSTEFSMFYSLSSLCRPNIRPGIKVPHFSL